MTSTRERVGFKVVFQISLLLLLACGALWLSPAGAQDIPPDTASDAPPPEEPSATGGAGQSGPEGPAGPAAVTCRLTQSYYKCCGVREYDPLNDTCCGSNLVVGQPFASCCGRVAFNADRQGCCNGRVVNRPGHRGALSCCGTVGYDPTVSSCCGSTVIQRSPVTGCCGGQPYFSPEPIGPGPPGGALGTPGAGSLANGPAGPPSSSSRAMVCCGCRLHSVSGYRGQASCCGEAPYDTTTHLCCNDALHSIVGKRLPRCCGSVMVDETSSTSCCRGRPYQYGAHGPLCCPNGLLDSCCFYPDRNATACT